MIAKARGHIFSKANLVRSGRQAFQNVPICHLTDRVIIKPATIAAWIFGRWPGSDQHWLHAKLGLVTAKPL